MITYDVFTTDRRYEALAESLRIFQEHVDSREREWGAIKEKEWQTQRNALAANTREARLRFVKVIDEADLGDAVECVFVARAYSHPAEMLDFSTVQSGLNDFIPHDYDLYEFMKSKIRKVLAALVTQDRAVTLQVSRAPGKRPYGARGDMWLWQTPAFVDGLRLKAAIGAAQADMTRTRQAALLDAFKDRGIELDMPKSISTIVLSLDDAEVILSMMT